ncbi:hypothetical protein [Caldalkalibacillus mannanilyticus]|uniref:hypothetical protein n=1 Tax=Caldalkalibacillus mannanilyticus TaxID=1418 RepID=UPI000468A7D5|nr:hypothetical protein [Caldalkalibacillus mannanilyticus]
MKNHLVMVLLFIALVATPITAFAINENAGEGTKERSKVIFSQEEVTDLNELFERAKRGQSDLKMDTILGSKRRNIPEQTLQQISSLNENPKAKLRNSNGVEAEAEALATTQLLKTIENEEGNVVNYYVTDTFFIIEEEQLHEFAMNSYISEKDKGYSAWDSTYGIRAHSRIYYDDHSTVWQDYFLMVGVEGSWKSFDRNVTLSPNYVKMGNTGYIKGSAKYTSQQIEEWFPDSLSFSYGAPSDWEPTTGGDSIGATTRVDISGYGDNWMIVLVNNITYEDSHDWDPNNPHSYD